MTENLTKFSGDSVIYDSSVTCIKQQLNLGGPFRVKYIRINSVAIPITNNYDCNNFDYLFAKLKACEYFIWSFI